MSGEPLVKLVRLAEVSADARFAAVGEIVLNRPDKRNALTPEMQETVVAHAAELDADPSIRCVLLRGEGAVFCAGFDLELMKSRETLRELLSGLSRAVRALRRATKPVVIAAHGAAVAGGCALLGGGDYIITDQSAKLGYPVLRMGVSPAVSAPTLLRAVRARHARERLLDTVLISGTEAGRIGLVDRVVDIPEDVIPRAQIEAAKLAEKPPVAVMETKRWLNEVDGSVGDEEFERALGASLAVT
ncbi:MAG TPA: enoyl-CoA hydratase/isomerase family protein [Phycisphaerales bacterium]|nr:enoyl-CoA hydratase/isomerase family protein [Phycisphaerales bacterium]